ncbi:AAA family ATPase [Gordonia sp. SID5947]|uniref:AAA family ATPase n=1 Tax=Gordonia sp. SID5947 TaxID=2690315 RepID=UPI00136E5E23|nr:SMC family ATPase [Gordonia sp. SID5947]MYR06107.1 AAA family ATPase [Gordonia sp. SID5947]
MRLHRLRMRAFGPFADEVVVDFDSLAGDGLFLLHGQTGAGKTTVLDGVAFALFGRVPGARDTNRRLHSDHSSSDQVPEVEMEATIGGRLLRITRSPDHHRPKKRGTGTTKVNARATLVWLDDSGPDLTRLPEIGEAVSRLLGMSADQFFQVVLLPQGEFARFLRATSEDREGLLERLFDTERFGDLEEWLRDRARQSAAALAEKTSAVDRIAGQIVALGGTEVSEPDMEWAQNCLDAARTDAAQGEDELTGAQAELDRAQAAHDRGARLVECRRRGDEAAARLAQLADGEVELTAAAAALEAGRRAAPIASVFEDRDRAAAGLASAEAECARLEAELAALDEGAALCRSSVEGALDAAIERWTAESGRWEPLAGRVARRPALVADIDRIDDETAAAERRIGEMTSRLAQGPQRREKAAAELARAVAARAQLPRLHAERDRIAAIAHAIAQRAALAPQIEHAEQRLLEARERHANAREHVLDVRERRLSGMAAELASALGHGKPCAVCGSIEHPRPAVSDEATTVGEAQEAEAVEAAQLAAESRSAAESDRAALVERRTHLDATIANTAADEVDADRARIAADLEDAVRSAERVPQLEAALKAIEAEVEKIRAELSAAETAQAGRRERLAALRQTLDELDADVAEATGGRTGVAQRRAELAELCRRAARLRDARNELVRIRRRRGEAVDRLAEKCAAAGFADPSEAAGALASEGRLAEWEAMTQQASRIRATAEATLADADVRAAMAAEAVDTDDLSASLAAARHVRDQVASRRAVAVRRLRDLDDYVSQFWAAADVLAPMRARHDELQGLAELVSGRGQNSRRMSLRSYVLAARLAEVLVAASVRLRQMSSGRYEFVHSDAVGPRGRRGGLGIEVRDEYTGVVRATTTLSGGETFFASLALALGLADVVAAESGGHVLDTIFIDEGFGALDPEALDLVMGVLDELRSGGRVVGVVSHVDELRARIPAQLHVVRGEGGSRLRMSGALGVS